LEISDEEHAAEDPERLDADQPVLRDVPPAMAVAKMTSESVRD
jgi:hypothetical protein